MAGLVPSEGRMSERRTAGYRGDAGEGPLTTGWGKPRLLKKKHLRLPQVGVILGADAAGR